MLWWLLQPGAPMVVAGPARLTVLDLPAPAPLEPAVEPEPVRPDPIADDDGGGGGGSQPAPLARTPLASPIEHPTVAPPPSGTTPEAAPAVELAPTPLPVSAAMAPAPPAPPVPQNGGGGGTAGSGTGFGTGDGSGTGSGSGGGSGSGAGGGHGAGTGRGVRAEWIRRPTDEFLSAAYPAEASRKRIRGAARLSCLVNRFKRPFDCRTVEEAPTGYGFGEGALWVISRQGLVRPPVARDTKARQRVAIVILFEPPPLPEPASE